MAGNARWIASYARLASTSGSGECNILKRYARINASLLISPYPFEGGNSRSAYIYRSNRRLLERAIPGPIRSLVGNQASSQSAGSLSRTPPG